MEAANTIALAGFAFALIMQAGVMVWWGSRISTTQAVHSKALEALPDTLRNFVTIDIGKGYQAQLDRLEHRDAEHDGKVAAIRQEAADRLERISARVTAHEQATSAATNAFAQALTKLDVTMDAMKEAVDRLSEAERSRTPPPSLIDQLRQFAELQAMLKKTA